MGGEEATVLPGAQTQVTQQPANPTVLNYAPGSRPMNTMPPFLTVNFIICMAGIYPPHP
jgi:microcystin-dependent protein